MHVASLELCKELYELSGWDLTDRYYDAFMHVSGSISYDKEATSDPARSEAIPAYDLGFLLRKLPKWLENDSFLRIEWAYIESRDFQVGYWNEKDADWDILVSAKKWWGLPDNEPNGRNDEYVKYMTPEDATAKLAIELFKQGILTPSSQETK